MAFLVVVVALILSVILAVSRPKVALLVAIFFVPWAGLDVDAGLRVTAYLVLITPLFAVCILRAAILRGTAKMAGLGAFWLVIGYAIIWTLVQIPFLPESTIAGGGLRQPAVRSTLQIFNFLITISPVWIVPMLLRDRTDLIHLGKVYIASAVLLASLGWLQLIIWVASGTDPFPIGFFDQLLGGQATQRSGVLQYLGGQIYRMSSFGGEPKGLGIGIAVALLLLQSGVKLRSRYTKLMWPFLLVSMLATFSTMSILGWLGATVVQLFVTPHCTIKSPAISGRFRGLSRWPVWLVPILLVVILSGKSGPVLDLFEMRTTGRITESERGLLEDFNIAVFDFLVDQPLWAITGTGLGNAHLYADPYLPDFALYYAAGTSFVAKSAVLRWGSELGGVSLLVFLSWAVMRIFRTVKLAHHFKNYSELAAITSKFSLPLIVLWLVTGYITMQFYVTIGFAIALHSLAKAECVDSFWETHRDNLLAPASIKTNGIENLAGNEGWRQ